MTAAPKVKTYTAAEPIYLSNEGRMVYAGETFTSSEPKGSAWIEGAAKKPDEDE